MLTELHVVDLGIVADLDVVLGPGLTAITGETGAGKTLLVEAVELLVGGRADPGLVREEAEEARVEGRFVDDEGVESVLARVVPRVGRSRAYCDGRLVTVAELAERGRELIDLHGQHDHRSLLSPTTQCAALDRYAGEAAISALTSYRHARHELRRLEHERASLGGDPRTRRREIDLLRFQIDEITAAGLDDVGEDTRLASEEDLLGDVAAARDALTTAYEAIEGRGLDALGAAVQALTGRRAFADLAARARDLQADTADVARELRLGRDGLVDDPERAAAVRSRRQLFHELCRKYGDDLGEVRAYVATASARLDELEGHEGRLAALEEELEARTADLRAASEALTRARRTAAAPLGEAVAMHLRELAMPYARLEVDVAPDDDGEDGSDRVIFLLAPNPGEPPRPVARAASGGELARAMLGLRVVLSAAPPSLVFDEVDAGIGGEAGLAVGRLLAMLGQRHQVLCVTHLPQVAAFADRQLVVEKRAEEGRTVARAAVVEGSDRIAELSRMLAGVGSSTHARRHAEELLATARRSRSETTRVVQGS